MMLFRGGEVMRALGMIFEVGSHIEEERGTVVVGF
jgi:hypothetical protein